MEVGSWDPIVATAVSERVPLRVARLDLALGALMTSKTSYITVVEWLMTFLAFWQCNTSNCKFAITKDGISVSLTKNR